MVDIKCGRCARKICEVENIVTSVSGLVAIKCERCGHVAKVTVPVAVEKKGKRVKA